MRTPAILAVLIASAFAAASPALADDDDSKKDADDSCVEPKTALMDVVRPTTLGCEIERARIRAYGWIEGMVSTSPRTEAGSRTGRVFDVEAEGFRLHQAYLAIERSLPGDVGCFDVGGKVAGTWGTDARFTHAKGLVDDQDGREQFDLLEAHALVRVPLAQGLTFKIGKCTTPMGFEVIEAANDLLPSRSFLFGYAIPFTHTGAIATLKASDAVSVSYGLVFGWDVFQDDNDALTHLGTFAWASPCGTDSVTVNGIVGAEQPHDESDLRTVVDATWTHQWTECWKTALNADVGREQDTAPGGGDAAWWGVAAYATSTVTDHLAVTGRAEWFRDRDGTRIGQEASLLPLRRHNRPTRRQRLNPSEPTLAAILGAALFVPA